MKDYKTNTGYCVIPTKQLPNCKIHDTVYIKTFSDWSKSLKTHQPQCYQCFSPYRTNKFHQCAKMCKQTPGKASTGCKSDEFCKVISRSSAYCEKAPKKTNCKYFNSGPSYTKSGCAKCDQYYFFDSKNKMCTNNCSIYCKPGQKCEVCNKGSFCQLSKNLKNGKCVAPNRPIPNCLYYKSGFQDDLSAKCVQCKPGFVALKNGTCAYSCSGPKNNSNKFGIKACPKGMFCNITEGKICQNGKATNHCDIYIPKFAKNDSLKCKVCKSSYTLGFEKTCHKKCTNCKNKNCFSVCGKQRYCDLSQKICKPKKDPKPIQNQKAVKLNKPAIMNCSVYVSAAWKTCKTCKKGYSLVNKNLQCAPNCIQNKCNPGNFCVKEAKTTGGCVKLPFQKKIKNCTQYKPSDMKGLADPRCSQCSKGFVAVMSGRICAAN